MEDNQPVYISYEDQQRASAQAEEMERLLAWQDDETPYSELLIKFRL